MKKVFAMGELLIDFMGTKRDVSLSACDTFIKKAGGAPPNALAALCKLGGEGYLASRVGNDAFGDFLISECKKNNIDTSMVIKDCQRFTTCAFVSLTSLGQRDFIFQRGADAYINYEELDIDLVRNCEIYHFGAATGLLDSVTYNTYMKVLDEAISSNKVIVFDPNFRQDFWKGDKDNSSIDNFISRCRYMISKSHVVKVSEEEAKLISEESSIEKAAEYFLNLGTEIVLVTCSDKGTYAKKEDYSELIPSIEVNCVDSTGAGDAFIGAFLYKMSSMDNINDLFTNNRLLKEFVFFSNKAGAICCTRLGAMEGMPSKDEMGLDTFMVQY